jgi:putative FmdB family regulatory protein
MPIYAYRCAACGHAKDVLQKLSDAPLSVCPACGAPRFEKQVTAAGFQLKGSGWYATDFRNGSTPAKDKPAADGSADKKPEDKAAAAPAPAAAPSAGAPAAPAPTSPAPPPPSASS